MKYLKDPSDLIAQFPKYLLIYDDQYEAITYLLRDVMNELSTKIRSKNSLTFIGLFQDIFDTMNPLLNNEFSAFDLEYDDNGFQITFLYSDEHFDRTGEIVNKFVRVEY